MSDLTVLIQQAQAGELAAFARLVHRYRGMALVYAERLLGDHHLAEDATQEALLQAYLDLATLREPMAFAGWLRRLVHKHCDRTLRRKQARLVALNDSDALSTSDPHTELERREESTRLRSALHRLGSHESGLLDLCYVRGLSHRQIARHLQLPETTVNIRLYSARQHLRKELQTMATGADLAALKPIHEQLKLLLQPHFSEAMAMDVQIDIGAPQTTTFGLFIDSLGHHSCTYYFIASPGDAHITLDLNVSLALALCDRCHTAEELVQEAEFRRSLPVDAGQWLLNYQLGILGGLIKPTFDRFVEAWNRRADL